MVLTNFDVAVWKAFQNSFCEKLCGLRVEGMADADFSACKAPGQHSVEQLLSGGLFPTAFVLRLQLAFRTGTPDHADAQKSDGLCEERTDAPVFCKIGE